MIGNLLVSPEHMRSAANELSLCVGRMETCFQNLKNTTKGSTSYWEGEAGEAHRQLYEKQLTTIDEILRRYREHVRDLNEMAGVYTEAESMARNLAEELPVSTL